MKRLFYSSLLLLTFSSVKAQQVNQNNGPITATESTDVIWKGKNVFNDNPNGPDGMKTQPRPGGYVNAPFDGGVVALIAMGVLYGRRQQKKNTALKTEESHS